MYLIEKRQFLEINRMTIHSQGILRLTSKGSEKMGISKKLLYLGQAAFSKEIRREKALSLLKREVKQSIDGRKQEVNQLSLKERIENEFRSLPIVTVFDDLVQGISGLEEVQKRVQNYPEEPYVWLMFAQALEYHKKTFYAVQGIKAPIDTIGSIIDVSMNKLADWVSKEQHTPNKALHKALFLTANRKGSKKSTMMIEGRCFHLLGKSTADLNRKEKYYSDAMVRYHQVIEMMTSSVITAEAFYYIAQIHGEMGNSPRYIHYMKKAIKNGLTPAHKELCNYLTERRIAYDVRDLSVPESAVKNHKFYYQYQKTLIQTTWKATSTVVGQQAKKLAVFTDRVLDYTLDKVLNKKERGME